MNRVYILGILAIGFFSFAVDSSEGILQAKKISDSSVHLEWQAIIGATKYKILYDESDLLDPKNPEPLLDTDYLATNTGDVSGMTPATAYTLLVRGYTDEGKEIGKTLPLHIRTYAAVLPMSIVGDPFTLDETTLEIGFSRVIDTKRFEILFKDINTNKTLPVSQITTSSEDLRTILVTFGTKFEISHTYELTLKKVFALDGTELPPENRTPLKILYGGSLPPMVAGNNVTPITTTTPSDPIFSGTTTPSLPAPLIESEPIEQPFQDPVSIDKLPQTGPQNFVILIVITLLIVFLLQRKLLPKQ